MATYRLAPVHSGRAQWDRATPIDQARPLSTRPDKQLTRRQAEVLSFIRAYLLRHGYPPTQRQIAEGVGLSSVSSVHYQLGRLEAGSALRRRQRSVRGLRLIEPLPSGTVRSPPTVPGGAG
jgi:repressor LexA